MSVELKNKFARIRSTFDGISITVSRAVDGATNCDFVVTIVSGTEVIGSAKDLILIDFFEDPDAVAIADSINTCLGILPTDADAYTGLEDWYTPTP